jgi:ATPase subunit of ABC transporter with duplicated ATPase domains
MSHHPIFLNNISVVYSSKTCFEDFSSTIYPGDRIALIGRNGSGKTSLLKMLTELPDVSVGFLPQLIEDDTLSGGQRFNAALSEALALQPDLLLLDEPTNHLDHRNRQSLMQMLKHFDGTVVIASHDVELLRTCVNIFWHFDNGKTHVFKGQYDNYKHEIEQKSQSIEAEVARLNRQKKNVHQALMKEQERASKSKQQGEKNIDQRKWPTVTSSAKARCAEETSGRKKLAIGMHKEALIDQLAEWRLSEVILPKFSLSAGDIRHKTIVEIRGGSCGYEKQPILNDINFTIGSADRLAIVGDNGCGKSTLVKAIRGDLSIWRQGTWFVPKLENIGYLDQHYDTLKGNTVLECIAHHVPAWSHADIRKHLNDFLFRKNEEVNAQVANLSGGEKARLSLALIAAKTPGLLILDEVTNNLDIETRDHVLQVLQSYPGAMIVISHDADFLSQVDCATYNIRG